MGRVCETGRRPTPGVGMDASEAIAREEIRDVISRYNHAGDRGDLDALVRCFTETGVLDLEGEDDCSGRAAIRERLSGVASDLAGRTAATPPPPPPPSNPR